MYSSKKPQELRKRILETTLQIEQIKKSGLLTSSESANQNYNKLLVLKAQYQKDLEESRKPILQKLAEKFTIKAFKNKKMICDYFHC